MQSLGFGTSHKLLPGVWQVPPPPPPDPPTPLEALRRSCTRLQVRSVQRRTDLQSALAAAAAALLRQNALVQRGARPPSGRGVCRDRDAQAAPDVMALHKVITASAAAAPASAGPWICETCCCGTDNHLH